ncbi:DUF481 domain-containing protein [Gilvimarinus sp. SDUM040013]|uniref:DUF481 domain-containing protein n=1 Tax=Gilvimarinus gilvus TaxID=3058038 RepID=A0ABU4RU08_9GAMM|nr:DUF481 domain-containing protein [Gilvimarinus sp. SDUM040013]MDO3384990.1 DUF481 domain-containing protein [Gilvimarinus sp. SDUM040013]MDX6848365.1 DUF481 domain-containing protein [Gilvimarinus sp. SDUM040013]
MRHIFKVIVTSGLLLLALIATAESEQKKKVWPDPPASLDGWDWVQLDSGEWLKGEIIGLYDKTLSFDSDFFDELSLDWSDDIVRVLSSQSMAVRLNSGETVWGPVDINQKTLRFSGPVTAQHPRADIVAMSRRGEREIDRWRVGVTLGGSLKEGNTAQRSLSSNLSLNRYTSKSVFALTYRGDYSETGEILTEESHRFSSRLDRFLESRLYWTPGYLEYFRDRSQNIDARITYSVFAGYYLLDQAHITWKVGGGPGYQYQEFTTAPQGQALSSDTAVITAESNIEWDVTSELTLSLLYQPQFTNEATGQYKHVVDAAFTVDLTEKLDFELSYLWDYTKKPQIDENGVLPKQNDYTITMGLKWSH